MKIADSNVEMSSKRSYMRRGFSMSEGAMGAAQGSGSLKNSRDAYIIGDYREDFLGTYERYANGNIAGEGNGEYVGASPKTGKSGILEAMDNLRQIRYQLLNQLMQRIMGFSVFGRNAGEAGNFGNSRAYNQPFNPFFASGGVRGVVSYEEYESTCFNAKGQAVTEDGRVIDFNMEVSMTRSYMEYMEINIPSVTDSLVDPLVINVGAGVTNLSDQKFLFDLDCDGKEEEISMLGRGSGFLALDKNGDGIINDGRELFGALSGDGFGDLRNFDQDQNGWIDENDEVFNRLKIWSMNEKGEMELMDLKDKDVGAIFLGEQKTNFDMYGFSGGLNGVVRSTGFFLKESGGMGTIQHVDMAAG